MGEAPLTATSPVAPQPPLPGMVLLTGSTHPLWRDRVRASCCPALLVAGPCPSCPLAFFSDTPAVIALSYKQGLVPFQSPGHVQSLTFLRHNWTVSSLVRWETMVGPEQPRSSIIRPAKAELTGSPGLCAPAQHGAPTEREGASRGPGPGGREEATSLLCPCPSISPSAKCQERAREIKAE